MFSKVFFLFAGVVVAFAAPDQPRTSYGPPRVSEESSSSSSSSFEHFVPSSVSEESFERFSPSSGSDESFESSEAKYAFRWSVEDHSTGNDFDHEEARDNDLTQGKYTVQLPDGRLQTVTYIVDGGEGYVADVKYEGEARYPEFSAESFESREFSAESFESREFSSGSDESSERRVYAPPKRTYLTPDSNESK